MSSADILILEWFHLNVQPCSCSGAQKAAPAEEPVVEDASRPRQRAADAIHWPFGAKRLTTSGFSSQSR